MKRTLVLAAIAGLTMTACKKDRVCTCTDTTISQSSTEPGYTYTPAPPTTNKTTYKKIKKNSLAAQECVSQESTYTYNYTGFTQTGNTNYVMTVNQKSDCELK
jgi:hypothetical protein